MPEIAFSFDLHNTIMCSNEAWINAFLLHSGNDHHEYIEHAVYHKQSRKTIAERIGVDYDAVYQDYCRIVKPSEKMIKLLSLLKQEYPIFLISSASYSRVKRDLESWNGENFFDSILTKETFDKSNYYDWESLIEKHQFDLIVYIGNDPEEDIIDNPKVIPMICGDFLNELNRLNLLIRRSEEIE